MIIVIGQVVVRPGPMVGETVVGHYFFYMDVLSLEVHFHEVERFRPGGGYAVVSGQEIQMHMEIDDRGSLG